MPACLDVFPATNRYHLAALLRRVGAPLRGFRDISRQGQHAVLTLPIKTGNKKAARMGGLS